MSGSIYSKGRTKQQCNNCRCNAEQECGADLFFDHFADRAVECNGGAEVSVQSIAQIAEKLLILRLV